MTSEYKNWTIKVEEKPDGWHFQVTDYSKQFVAAYGPFTGPASALSFAHLLIDVLKENIRF